MYCSAHIQYTDQGNSNIMTYLRLSIITAAIAILLSFAKMYSFSWGDIQFLANGATINDLWYYNLQCWSTALFCSSMACLTTYILENNPNSSTCWNIKYFNVLLAMIALTRAIAHLLTYRDVTDYEVIVYVVVTLVVYRRALIWYKIHIYKKHETPTTGSSYKHN